jgi:arylsulfatase A-like enzyme
MARGRERRNHGLGSPAWRIAALPSLALLGAVLPLVFIPQIEDFLYYLRPGDLLPAYATAWLFLAALALPAWVVLAVLLTGLERIGARALRDGFAAALIAAAAALSIGALLYCLLVWVQTFGLLGGVSFRRQLLWAAIALGVLPACVPRVRALAARGGRPVTWLAALGALSTLSIAFSGWPGTAGAPLTPARAAPHTVAPNVVLLTIDALSAEHMSLYGAARATTPMLSAFAASADSFEHAYANGNFTTPGVASILTGTRPWTHRALQLQSWPELAARRESLPAVLRRAGYRTGYVSTNAVAGAARNGLGRYFGFASRDRIADLELCTDALSALLRNTCAVASMPLFAELVSLADDLHGRPGKQHYDPRLATRPALAWLQGIDRSRPVFLWVHLFPPHSPYAAPAPWLGSFDASDDARTLASTEPHWNYTMSQVSPALVQALAGRYDESIRYVDHFAGEFLARALQLLGPDTVVIVTADHGESFRHGYGAHTGPGLYNEIIHIPLIIKLPHQTQGRRCDATAEQVDIAPTLAQLAGIQPPALWEGHSLLGACNGARPAAGAPARAPAPDDAADGPAFSMNFEQNPRYAALRTGSIAVIDGRWKLVHYLGQPRYPLMPPLRDTLYDLASDPAETINQAAAHPDEVARLRALIDAGLARHGGPTP